MKVYDRQFMELAIKLAEKAQALGEVPVGCVIISDGTIIAQAHNQPIASHNPCAHAEILALAQAGQHLQNYRLNHCTLYVTLEPCSMCVSAMIHARIARCVFGAADPKTGALGGAINLPDTHTWNHRFDVEGGVLQEACAKQLTDFFIALRST